MTPLLGCASSAQSLHREVEMNEARFVRCIIGSAILILLIMALPVRAGEESIVPAPVAESATVSPVVTETRCAFDRTCCPGYRFWASAEYLVWWVENAPLPATLLTTGPNTVLGPSGRPGTL